MWRCSGSLVEFYALSVSTLTPQHLNILTSEAPSHLILALRLNDHQILSKIAPCTPVFTKFEPRIGKSTTPKMDKWRPKTMRRTPKSGIFRPSARPFFHQKRGRTALWIHWRALQLIEYHVFSKFHLSLGHYVIMSLRNKTLSKSSNIIIFKYNFIRG